MERLLACLVVAAAIGCGSRSTESGPVGEVATLEGRATATRGDTEPRDLTVGAKVFADDLIRAGEASEVVIRLEKNNAPLALSDGASAVISKSAAWSAPRTREGTAIAGDNTDPSLAAGRSGARESGSHPSTAAPNNEPTGAVSVVASKDNPQQPGGTEVPSTETGAAVAKVTATLQGAAAGDGVGSGGLGVIGHGGGGSGEGQGRGAGGDKYKDKHKSKTTSGSRQDETSDQKNGGTDNTTTANPKTPDETTDVTGGEPTNKPPSGSQVQPSKAGKLVARNVTPAKSRSIFARLLRRHQHFVGVCLVDHAGKVSFSATIELAVDGEVAKLTIEQEGLSKDELACVRRTLGRKYPPAIGGLVATFVGTYE